MPKYQLKFIQLPAGTVWWRRLLFAFGIKVQGAEEIEECPFGADYLGEVVQIAISRQQAQRRERGWLSARCQILARETGIHWVAIRDAKFWCAGHPRTRAQRLHVVRKGDDPRDLPHQHTG